MGCRGGNAADDGKGFRSLPMTHCQKRLAGADAYSVLSVADWVDLYRNSRKLSVLWADKRPENVIWRREAGRPEANNCFQACYDKGDARWISIGVTGCECGISGTNVDEDSLDWSVKYDNIFYGPYTPARGFFLMKIKGVLRGFRPKSFEGRQTYISPPGKESRLPILTVPHQTSDKIASMSSMSKMVKERHRYFTYSTIRASVVPKKARVYQANYGFQQGRSSNEATFKPVLTMSTYIGRHRSQVRRERGYFGYEKLPFYRDDPVKENTVFRVNKISDYPLFEFSSQRLMATEVGERFGYRTFNKKSSGQIFYINPTMFGDCFTGVANETGWKNMGNKLGTLRKCVCACSENFKTQKQHLKAAIIQSGKCFCSASSEQLGNLIASVPKPASCPEGTVREAYQVTMKNFQRRTNQFCKGFQENTDLHVIGPGMTGNYIEKGHSSFRHTSTRGKAVSEDRLKATLDERVVSSTGNFTVELHNKRGTTQFFTGSMLKKSLFQRTFSLNFAVKELHAWHEEYDVESGYERQEEKYEKYSYRKETHPNGAYGAYGK